MPPPELATTQGQPHRDTPLALRQGRAGKAKRGEDGEQEDCLKKAAHTLPTTECGHINNALSKDDRVQAHLYGQAHGDNVGHRAQSC